MKYSLAVVSAAYVGSSFVAFAAPTPLKPLDSFGGVDAPNASSEVKTSIHDVIGQVLERRNDVAVSQTAPSELVARSESSSKPDLVNSISPLVSDVVDGHTHSKRSSLATPASGSTPPHDISSQIVADAGDDSSSEAFTVSGEGKPSAQNVRRRSLSANDERDFGRDSDDNESELSARSPAVPPEIYIARQPDLKPQAESHPRTWRSIANTPYNSNEIYVPHHIRMFIIKQVPIDEDADQFVTRVVKRYTELPQKMRDGRTTKLNWGTPLEIENKIETMKKKYPQGELSKSAWAGIILAAFRQSYSSSSNKVPYSKIGKTPWKKPIRRRS